MPYFLSKAACESMHFYCANIFQAGNPGMSSTTLHLLEFEPCAMTAVDISVNLQKVVLTP